MRWVHAVLYSWQNQLLEWQEQIVAEVRSKYQKFRAGPLATYLTYRPVKNVEDEDEEEATQTA